MTRHNPFGRAATCPRQVVCRRLRLTRLGAVLVLAAAVVTGMVSHSSHAEAMSETLPATAEVSAVPFFAQEDYQCGPAALAMALSWGGLSVKPDALVEQVYSPARQGSLPSDMIAAARRHGRVAYPISTLSDVLQEVAAGHPVIVLQDLGNSLGAYWHFAVVVGYDKSAGKIFLHSGVEERDVMSFRRFERAWEPGENWALVVLPPTRLPATATVQGHLEAVTPLEQANQWDAAAAAYRTALSRWPESLGAAMGLGNSRYALGDLSGAETAFREATQAHPDAAPAFNNLAHVLAEVGKLQEALAMAQTAVRLGGPEAHVYRTTLSEIEARSASVTVSRPPPDPQPVQPAVREVVFQDVAPEQSPGSDRAAGLIEDSQPFDGRWRGKAQLTDGLGCFGTAEIDMTIKDAKVRGRWRVIGNNRATGDHRLSGSIGPTGRLDGVHADSAFLFVLDGQLSERAGRGEFRVAGWRCGGPWRLTRVSTGERTETRTSHDRATGQATTDSVARKLEEINRLLARGLISSDEAAAKRQQILSQI